MGLIETASANSVWRGMDYYENRKVVSWAQTGTFAYDGIVSGSEGNKYTVPAASLEYTLCTAYSYHCMGYQ